MKTAAVICHARYLDLAAFDEPLRACGYHVRYYDAGYDSFGLDPVATDLVTVLPEHDSSEGARYVRFRRRTDGSGQTDGTSEQPS
jgi:hypothetical protein